MKARPFLIPALCALLLAPPGIGQGAELAAGQHGALLAQCRAALPQAEPRRAQEIREAMFRLQISMSWRRAPGRLSPEEARSAAVLERRAYEALVESCKPLLL